jgi:conjugative relaxase-like TrwC/TraI family protein
MLNIGRMAPGRADYYLTAVARREDDGVEGYYLARGEEPGRWLGDGAETLGLSGEVTAEQLRSVLDARHPDTGEQLAAHPARKVPGFDHTFRAPKSVSLLWGLGDQTTAEQVVAAHDAAVDAAMGYVQRAAGFTRRGAGGAETVEVDGFVAAAFRHRTSRADDPLLHTHVLVANLARTSDDGIWRTLDSRKLFAHAKTAGVLYQAHLRQELTRRLGVAWQPVVNGHADIDGVDRQLIETFSRRRASIVARMADRGEASAAAAQTATLATRQAKTGHPSEAELRDAWSHRAAAAGVRPGWHERLLDRVSWEQSHLGQLWQQLVVDEGLTESSSTFTRRDVLQQLAGRLPAGAPVAHLEWAADTILEHDTDLLVELGPTRGHLTAVDVIRRADGRVVAADAGERRYTTKGLLLTEQRAVNLARGRQFDGIAVAEPAGLDRALRRRTLSAEQETMVRRLTTSGAGAEVVVGKAGTGKTYALDAAREAWQASGIRVTGVALAARAALELEQSAGIPSTTLARLTGQLDGDRVGSPLQPGSVLVVDEAGMVGTRQLARLLEHAQEQQVKVVLVGDPGQLPEIDAGGLFRAMTTRLAAIELTENRRQTHTWEQAALDELRHGDPDQAIATYTSQGRIRTADTAEAVRQQLVDDWWATARDDLAGSLMIGLRRDDAADLNHRARARMLTDGRLTGPSLVAGEVELQAGDRIVCLRNQPRLGVVNGTRATVTRVGAGRHAIEAVDDHGVQLLLPADYVEAGHVTHGYSITGHKAQGLTCDHTYTLGTETLYREWGYVAMSRGRITNQLYHGPAVDDDDALHHHVYLDEDGPDLTSRLRRTRAEEQVSPELAEIASAWQELDSRLDQIDVGALRELHRSFDELEQRRQGLSTTVERLQLRLADEGSGGLSRRRRRAVQELEADLELAKRHLAHVTERHASLGRSLAGLPDRDELAALLNRRAELDEQLGREAAARVRAFRSAPPSYLTTALGPRPTDASARERWERTAAKVEHYRLRWQVTDPNNALGSGVATRRMQQARSNLRDEIERTLEDLSLGHVRHRSLSRAR